MPGYKVCVLIPTYNNERTLKRVIDGVLAHTGDVIVINDGSTDTTAEILSAYPELRQIHLPENRGKGLALRTGFDLAVKEGFDFAITIDSDGQHFPEDIPVFINALKKEPDPGVLLIGARDMDQESVPGKSSFGNRFSNFWYWVETGIRLSDTQSGYRLYPLRELEKLSFFTNRFEFEIEVIVKAAWKGIRVKNVPVRVYYDKTERVSHFRPVKDFFRISLLNTWLVFLTFFYIRPREFFRNIKKKGFKHFIMEDILGSYDSPRKKALSIALGVFVGLSPFWGLHTPIVIFMALALKLNKVIAFTASNISIPPFIPFVIYASLETGNFILGEKHSFSISEIHCNTDILNHIKAYIIGSFSLGIVAASLFGMLAYVFLSYFDKKMTLHNG